MKKNVLLLMGIPVLAGASNALAVTAVTVYTANGFEAPTFTTTNLTGQDVANVPSGGGWAQQASDGSATVVTTSSIPGGAPAGWGGQAVKVTRVTNDGYYFPYLSPTAHSGYTPSGANTTVNISWSQVTSPGVTPTDPATGPYGPMVGITADDDSTGPVHIVAEFGIDASTGELIDVSHGVLNTLPGDPKVAFGSPDNLTLSLNYTTQTYEAVLNGSVVDTENFNAGSSTLTDAPISTVVDDGGNPNNANISYVDNYSITAVPEPTSIGAATLIAGLLVRRRRTA